MKLSVFKGSVSAIALAALLACGSDSTGLSNDPVVGAYTATEFVTTGSSGQTNQLLAGSTVSIVLLNDHSTAGDLHLVATAQNPAFDGDLAGTWTRTGNTVRFNQSADTFIRNMDFTVVQTSGTLQLVADHVFAGTRVQLTLTQGTI